MRRLVPRGCVGWWLNVQGFRAGRTQLDTGVTRGTLEIVAVYTPDGWQSASGKVMLTISGDRSDLRPGDAIEAAGGLAQIGAAAESGRV